MHGSCDTAVWRRASFHARKITCHLSFPAPPHYPPPPSRSNLPCSRSNGMTQHGTAVVYAPKRHKRRSAGQLGDLRNTSFQGAVASVCEEAEQKHCTARVDRGGGWVGCDDGVGLRLKGTAIRGGEGGRGRSNQPPEKREQDPQQQH